MPPHSRLSCTGGGAMKVISLTLWARNPHIAVAVRNLLRPLSAISLVPKVSTDAEPTPSVASPCPHPIKVIVLARDPLTEAFVREQLRAFPNLTCLCKQQNNPDVVLMQHPLLTVREQRVLQACALHDHLAEVAASLYISEATVKKHLGQIYSKLGRHSLHRALLCAIQWGLMTLPEEVQCP